MTFQTDINAQTDIRRVTLSSAGAAALLTSEANGFAADFTYATDAKRVAVKQTLGPELVTNGGFDSGTGWTQLDVDWTIAGGVATKVAGAATRSIGGLGFPVIIGRTYRLTYTLVATGSGGISCYVGGAGGTVRTVSGTFSDTVTATSTAGPQFAAASTWTGTLDNVSVKEVVSVGTTTTTEYAVDAFFANAGTSPKQVYDVAGTLGWSPHNMVLQSENLLASWTFTGGAATTATFFRPDTSLNIHRANAAAVTAVAGNTYAFSAIVSAGGYSKIGFFESSFANSEATFDLGAGTVLYQASSIASATITALGGGQYLIACSFVAPSTTARPYIYVLPDSYTTGGYTSWTPDGVKGVNIFRVQVNRGSVPTAYLPTTTAARYGLALDTDPVTHAAKGLLCEPAATNLLLRSSEFDNASWVVTNCTTAANAIAAPNGSVEADSVIPASGSFSPSIRQTGTVVAATTYTLSAFVKNGTLGNNWCSVGADSTASFRVWFNLATGAKGTSTGSPTSYNITSVGNGWYRLDLTFVAGTTTAQCYLIPRGADGSTAAITGDGTSPAFYAWGAQLETGTVATSPIPTYAASATRAADNYNFALSTIPALGTEYSVYAKARYLSSAPVANAYVWAMSDGTGNEINGIRRPLSGKMELLVIDGGAVLAQALSVATVTPPVTMQISTRSKANDVGISLNGATPVLDTAVTLPTVTTLYFGNFSAASLVSLEVEKLIIVPRGVIDVELPTWRYVA